MQIVSSVGGINAVGCGELGESGIVDSSRCCEICHSAQRYQTSGALGPCYVVLPNGREALVCCASKKQLLERGGIL